jgi:hypothetical protein
MWQEVEVFESGVMRRADGSADGPTWRRWVVREIFRVGTSKCTAAPDTQSQDVEHRTCPLCDYVAIRTVRQADDVKPTFLGDSETRTRNLGDVKWLAAKLPPADPELDLHIDDPNYHLLYFSRDGTACLFREKRIRFENAAILIPGPIVADSGWEAVLMWARPCKASLLPLPPPTTPPPPLQPPAPMPPAPITSGDDPPPPRVPLARDQFGPISRNAKFRFRRLEPEELNPR